jgi:hypothetical protein
MGIRESIALVLAAVLFASGWYMGALSGRLGKANAEQRATADKLGKVMKEQAADREDRKKLQASIDKMPRAERKVRNAVAANPSKCDRPAAVADSVQAAIDSSNASRKVSGNP